MADSYEVVKGFATVEGKALYDYDFLHNKPDIDGKISEALVDVVYIGDDNSNITLSEALNDNTAYSVRSGESQEATSIIDLNIMDQTAYTLVMIKAYGRAGFVDIYFNINVNTPKDSWTTVAMLPKENLPLMDVYNTIICFTPGKENLHLRITTEGEIQLCNGAENANYLFHDSFIQI